MAEQNEKSEMKQAGDFLEIYSQGINTASSVSEAITQNKFYIENTKIKDDLDNEVVIPAGFKLASDSATKVEDGIVIEDLDGNQFVWVPAKTGAGATINLENEKTATIIYQRTEFKQYPEDYNNFSETMPSIEEKSVNDNGGYYIGRYEVGDKESTEKKIMRNVDLSQKNTITIKKGQTPYNFVSYNNAKTLAEEMHTVQGYTTSTTKLISSYAWDTAINFIQINNSDYGLSSEEGNYHDTEFDYKNLDEENENHKDLNSNLLVPTGQTKAVSNIYDMGGNLYEYCSENSLNASEIFVVRGGDHHVYYNSHPSGFRRSNDGKAGDYHTFRVTLFIL